MWPAAPAASTTAGQLRPTNSGGGEGHRPSGRPKCFCPDSWFKRAAKSMKLSHFCAWKAACNLPLTSASTSALLMDPDRRAEVLTVWIPKFCPGKRTGIAQVSSTQRRTACSATREGCITIHVVLVAHWKVPGHECETRDRVRCGDGHLRNAITMASSMYANDQASQQQHFHGKNCTMRSGGCARRGISMLDGFGR